MTTPEDRPAPTGGPDVPRWDAPPAGQGQPPAWDGPPAQQQGWGPPPQYAAYPPATVAAQDGKAVAALVMAIVSWVMLPFIGAVVALFLAGSAQRDIAASGGRLGGDGLVTAAKVVAWANIVLCLLAALAVVVVVVLLASTGFS